MIDEFLELISKYEHQINIYNALVPSEDHNNEFANSTFLPIYNRLVTDPPLPATPSAVIRGLECAHRELIMALDNEFAISIVGVCIVFLKRHFEEQSS